MCSIAHIREIGRSAAGLEKKMRTLAWPFQAAGFTQPIRLTPQSVNTTSLRNWISHLPLRLTRRSSERPIAAATIALSTRRTVCRAAASRDNQVRRRADTFRPQGDKPAKQFTEILQ